jgi:hypothetical protein
MTTTPDIKRAAQAMCKRHNTHQCAAICLSQSSSFECPEQVAVWGEYAVAVLSTLAESEAFVEAAAEAIRLVEQGHRNLNDYSHLPPVRKHPWQDKARAALRAGLPSALGRKP